jgi:hypothetical protein
MVFDNVEHNLTFMARKKLRRTTELYFIKGCISPFEVFKCFFRNVGDLSNFR